jgi:dihydroorotate dehydrogenase
MIGTFATAAWRAAMRPLPAEAAHTATIALMRRVGGLMSAPRPAPVLHQRLFGLDFTSPIGLAAGFDKNAEVVNATQRLGFGFVEIGTVTPRPQVGNPKPRIFRLAADQGIINRLGFNNVGADAAAAHIHALKTRTVPIGVNIGCNKDSPDPDADYELLVRRFSPLADYLVVNVSSPNTPGLRAMQDPAVLGRLLAAVVGARPACGPPIFLKLAPDLHPDDCAPIIETALMRGIDALIISNTTLSRPALQDPAQEQAGGLSGRPLAPLALDMLRRFARVSAGRLPLIAAGGIDSADEAYRRLRAGAQLLQLYTGMVYHGPALVAAINTGLAVRLEADGITAMGAIPRDHLANSATTCYD